MLNLKKKAIGGAKWSLIEALGVRGVKFLIGIVLARLLLPAEFGLIGMLAIFIALSEIFLDGGFGAALIQKQDTSSVDINSMFYFNLLVGLVGAGVLLAAAPLVAGFYREELLTPLLRLLSVVLIIDALALVQNILLRKALNFRAEAVVVIASTLVSSGIAVAMAVSGYGVWSLAAQQVSHSLIRCILLWVYSPWRPGLQFSFGSLRRLFRFGSRLLAAGVIGTAASNAYLVVIGRLFSPADLGFFTRAHHLEQLPSRTISSLVARVIFPTFSVIQDDPARVKRGMRKALAMVAFVNFPAMIGLAVVARPLILMLLTERWAPSIPYLQVMCAIGLVHPLQSINRNVLTAMGRSDLYMRLELLGKALLILNVAVTWRWGIMALILGQVAVSILTYTLTALSNRHTAGYSLTEQLADVFPYFVSALAMGGVGLLIGLLPIGVPFVMVTVQVTVSIAVYLELCILFRLPAYSELKSIAMEHFARNPPTT